MRLLDRSDSQVRAALERLQALEEYSRATGFRTTRAVNDLMGSLSSEILTAVIYEMKKNRKENSHVVQAAR